ncbi:MAG TPA: hypothetical protein VEB68_03820 [Croceibacterium sp.]|nr:hypothetical protein [Croceibacterium sp.]
MSASLILLAAALSAPRLDARFEEQVNERYPQWALHTETSAAALVELVVKPNGRIERCELLDAVGSERLAEEMCQETEGTRLRPATDAAGNPTYGVMRTLLQLTVPGDGLATAENTVEPIDLELTHDSLPAGYPGGFVLEVDLLVDRGGSVAACDAAYGGPPAVFEPYVAMACEEARALELAPLAVEGDAARPYVTRRRVRFQPEPSQA